MRHTLIILSALGILVLFAGAQEKTPSLSSVFHNDRLKTLALKGGPISGDNYMRIVSGFWMPESNDPSKALVFPQQVKITCIHIDKTCKEISITLATAPGMISIQDIDDTDYDISSWDGHGLIASYGGGVSSPCQRHVLTMDFDSGAVSVSDIPTHKKGCEAFRETDSYHLVRGNYWVDTSPGNDMDKPRK
jgi:hypothetical protein